METYRMTYDLAGQRKEVIWTPKRGGKDLPAFARWVMSQEFPEVTCPVSGMEHCVLQHGITAIRSPDLCSPVVTES